MPHQGVLITDVEVVICTLQVEALHRELHWTTLSYLLLLLCCGELLSCRWYLSVFHQVLLKQYLLNVIERLILNNVYRVKFTSLYLVQKHNGTARLPNSG